MLEEGEATFYALRPMPIQRCCKFLTSTCFRNLRFLVISLCVQHKNITLASKTLTQMVSRLKLGDWAGTQILSKCFFVSRLSSSTLSSYWLSARSGSREYILHRAQGKVRSCKMGCFCDCKMDQGFFQVSSFPLTIQSQRHMLPTRGPCLARHTSTSAGGSPAADSPPTSGNPLV